MKNIVIALLLLVSTQCFGTNATFYVKQDVVGGVGTSWSFAFAHIQDALDVACAGDTIWVASGTYIPIKDKTGNLYPANDSTKTFYINKDIAVYGGFVGNETHLNQRD